MLPLSLLTAAQGQPMMVELKSGETLNGHLVSCDTWMNLTLKEVVQSSPDGENFVKLPECYVRGYNIKYMRVPDELLDMIKEQDQQNRNDSRGQHYQRNNNQRGNFNNNNRNYNNNNANNSVNNSNRRNNYNTGGNPNNNPSGNRQWQDRGNQRQSNPNNNPNN